MMYYNGCSISGSFIGALYLKTHEIIKKSSRRQRVEVFYIKTPEMCYFYFTSFNSSNMPRMLEN